MQRKARRVAAADVEALTASLVALVAFCVRMNEPVTRDVLANSKSKSAAAEQASALQFV